MLSIINPEMKPALTPRWPLQKNQGKESFKRINIPKQNYTFQVNPKEKLKFLYFLIKFIKSQYLAYCTPHLWLLPGMILPGYLSRPFSPLLHHFPHESCPSLTTLWALLCQHSVCSVMYLKQNKLPVCCSSELELFEETHRQRLTESAPWGCCKSAVLAVKLLGGSSEAACGKKNN